MTDDFRRRPPPRFPRPGDPELVRLGAEDEPPETQREVVLPPPPRIPLPREPFRMVKGRAESYVELSAQISDIGTRIEAVVSSQAVLIGNQRKQAQQIDGLGSIVNQRAEILHRELALLRATVKGDHGPRLEATEQEVQKLTAGEKVKVAATSAAVATGKGAAWTGRYASYVALAAVVLRLVAKRWPEFGSVVDEVLGGLGL